MCLFSRPVKHVSRTNIFARLLPEERRQILIYSMNVEIADELAMVLPLPIAAEASEDCVRFVDLSGYAPLFVHLAKGFPVTYSYPKSRGIMPQRQGPPKLQVHDVGAFEASFVPSPRDFARLDDRFRLSKAVFEKRAEYKDYGFAVFQLKPQKGFFGQLKRQTIHPMAFTFPTRRPASLFFPTLHVHDGDDVPERALFDHSLFCQFQQTPMIDQGFEKSDRSMEKCVDIKRSKDLIAPKMAYRRVIDSEQVNADCWIELGAS
jgi:hypothetical protein